MNEPLIRQANKDDIKKIIELQTTIFNVEQKIPTDDIAKFLAKNPKMWCAVINDEVISAAASWEENGKIHWGRFVTKNEYRGMHIGTKLAKFSFDDLFSDNIDKIYMEARETTVNIICNMGGKITGKPFEFYQGTVTPLVLCKDNYYKK